MTFWEYIKSLLVPDPDIDLSEEQADPIYHNEELDENTNE